MFDEPHSNSLDFDDDDSPFGARRKPLTQGSLSLAATLLLLLDLLSCAHMGNGPLHLALELGGICFTLLAAACLWVRGTRIRVPFAAWMRTRRSPPPPACAPGRADHIDGDLWKQVYAAMRGEPASTNHRN